MKNINLKGCGTALVTPFKDGAVDYDAFRNLVKLQVEAGIDFLLPLGTTGETPCLSNEERRRILQITKEEAGSIPVIVGGGTNSLAGTLESMAALDDLDPDAYLIVVPYYNKPTQEGMYQYFKAVAAGTDKPVILYNVPGRTGVNMKSETTLRLAREVENIVAVKEASGNYFQALEIIKDAPQGFDVLCGDDDLTYQMMAAGGSGVISVASNIVPAQLVQMTHLLLEGKKDQADAINNRLKKLYKACFVESNPIPTKAALNLMGLCEYEFRLPLCPGLESTTNLMKEVLAELK